MLNESYIYLKGLVEISRVIIRKFILKNENESLKNIILNKNNNPIILRLKIYLLHICYIIIKLSIQVIKLAAK